MQIKRKHIAGYAMHEFCDLTFNENELHANALVANCYKQPHRSTPLSIHIMGYAPSVLFLKRFFTWNVIHDTLPFK